MQSDSRDFTLNLGFVVVQTKIMLFEFLIQTSFSLEPNPYEYQWK